LSETLTWPPRGEDLRRLYLEQHLSAMKIARAYRLRYASPKTAESTVLYHLKRNGISRRDPAEHIRKVTEEMAMEWARRYESGESLKQIAAGKVEAVTVWNHLRKQGVQLRDKVEAQIKAVTKYERTPFAGDNLERCYLMGLRYGDLDVVRHGRAIRVRLSTTHPAMADLFASSFSRYGHIQRYPRTDQLVGHEWTLECDLDDSFEFLLAKPSISDLKQLPPTQLDSLLAGFFDAEGTVYMHKKYERDSPELQVTNTDLPLLRLMQESFSEKGIHSVIQHSFQAANRIPRAEASEIRKLAIWRLVDVKSALESLALRHEEKVRRSKLILSLLSNEMQADEFQLQWRELTDSIKRGRLEFVGNARESLERRLGRETGRKSEQFVETS
jgi:intein-encoded DNA endonuclease-like protein